MVKTNKQNKLRFHDAYNIMGDFADIEKCGLLPCQSEFDLGTPNLDRNENILILASNTTIDKSSLALKLKWRPINNNSKQQVSLVSMITSLTLGFENDKDLYKSNQLETYTPIESQAFPNRLMQYGSNGSKLKLFINCPYRRMRLVFRGQMIKNNEQQVFVKLNLVINSTTKIFDFKEEYNEKYVKNIFKKFKNIPYKTFLNDLFLHDRHEQLVRLVGDCTIRSDADTKSDHIKKYNIMQWGFYGRHFLDLNNLKLKDNDKLPASLKHKSTQRVLALFENGQSFHLGQLTDCDNIDLNNIKFGYACFTMQPVNVPIEKSFDFDWSQEDGVDSKINKFKIGSICCGHKTDFECSGELRFSHNKDNNLLMFDAKLGVKNGFAWISTDDNCDLIENELEAIMMSRQNYLDQLDKGRLAQEPKFELNQLVNDKCCPIIVPISSTECRCSDLVGSKASSLAQLVNFSSDKNDNFIVPKGFALTRYVYDELVATQERLRVSIERLESFVSQQVDYNDVDDKEDANNNRWLQELPLECARVRDTLHNIDLETVSVELVSAIDENIEQVFGVNVNENGSSVRVAIRSSSWGEDEADMSAAGQLDTKLNIECNRKSILKAILDCYASKFSLENIEYKRQHGLPLNMPMGIVVQEMINCHKAGVMFTCDPTSGDDRIVLITANYGLGESVVSGQSEPDTIFVQRVEENNGENGTKLRIRNVVIGEKKVITGLNGSERNLDRDKCCLSDDECLKLAQCGLLISKYFHSSPRDIEWGLIENSDQIYLFQARPITGLDVYSERELMHECDRPSMVEVDFCSRCNVGEVMPFAVTPFTLTHQLINWNLSGYRFISQIVGRKIPFVPHCNFELHIYGYYAFFNVRFSSFIPLTTEKEKSLVSKAAEMSLFGHEVDPPPELIESGKGVIREKNPFTSFRFLWYVKWLRFTPEKIVARQKRQVQILRQQVNELKLAYGYEKNKLMGLTNQLNALFGYFPDNWLNHIAVSMIVGSDNMLLFIVLSKYIKDPRRMYSTFSKLVSGGNDNSYSVISAEIPRRFKDLAEQIKRTGGFEELEKFLDLNTKEAIEYLNDAENNPELSDKFKEFIERFGHRCYNEFEYAQKPWREDLKGVIEMVKRNCRSLIESKNKSVEVDNEKRDEKGEELANKTKSDTIDEILASSDFSCPVSFKDRLLIKHLLVPSCRARVQTREHTKDILVDLADIMRQASRLLAREMCRQQRLPDESLFYYLLINDINPLIEKSQPQIVMQALRRRQMFKKQFDGKVYHFDEIIRGPDVFGSCSAKDDNFDSSAYNCLYGTPASSGSIRGCVSLVKDYADIDKVRPGTILVTHSTDIAFSAIFPIINGIITEVGGLISHGAVIAREYGLPSVLGVQNVTKILEDNELILLDADNGEIVRLSRQQENNDTANDMCEAAQLWQHNKQPEENGKTNPN